MKKEINSICYSDYISGLNLWLNVEINGIENNAILRLKKDNKEVVLYINNLEINDEELELSIADYEKCEIDNYDLVFDFQEEIC